MHGLNSGDLHEPFDTNIAEQGSAMHFFLILACLSYHVRLMYAQTTVKHDIALPETTDIQPILSDTVLIATIDGALHALSRDTGKHKWSVSSPWADEGNATHVSHQSNSNHSAAMSHRYLVEPSDKGQLWLYVNRSGAEGGQKLHKLPLDIAQLVDASPLSLPGGKLLSGSKVSRLMGVDIQTGRITDIYGKESSGIEKNGETDLLDVLQATTTQSQIVNIGRIDYHMTIHQASFAKHLKLRHSAPLFDLEFDDHLLLEEEEDIHLHFSTYTPNTLTLPPQQHSLLQAVQNDSKFIAPTPDGHVICTNPAVQWLWKAQSQPIAVFDILSTDSTTHPTILKHPVPETDKIHSSPLNIPNKHELSAILMTSSRYHDDLYVLSSQNFPHIKLESLLPPSTEKRLIRAHLPVKQAEPTFWPGLSLPGAVNPSQIESRRAYPLLDGPISSNSIIPNLHTSNLVTYPVIALTLLIGAFIAYMLYQSSIARLQKIPLIVDKATPSSNKIGVEPLDGEERDTVDDLDPTSKKGRRRKRGKRLGNGSGNNLSEDVDSSVIDASSSLTLTSEVLGYGSHGTMVFKGGLQGRAVAVKRMLPHFTTLASHEISILHESDTHPNVVRYFLQVQRPDFLYIVVELAECSLADLVERPRDYTSISSIFRPVPAVQDIMRGLRHLHDLKLCHRDLKPANILLTIDRSSDQRKVRCLISDMGLCKRLDSGESSFPMTVANANNAVGTVGWRAPEVLRGDVKIDVSDVIIDSTETSSGSGVSNDSESRRLTRMIDIFAAGLITFYIMSNGQHPFGDRFVRESNILQNRYDLRGLLCVDRGECEEVKQLVTSMIATNAKSRPQAAQVLLHPLFWSASKHLSFLTDTSDRFEIIPRDKVVVRDVALVRLEAGASHVVGEDWLARLDDFLLENLGKFRKYDGKSVQDLLRAMRNKKHHYQDLPQEVQLALGSMPSGFLQYFTSRFPLLITHLHAVVLDTGFANEPMFDAYFKEIHS